MIESDRFIGGLCGAAAHSCCLRPIPNVEALFLKGL